jgi:prevent-host-death family protein
METVGAFEAKTNLSQLLDRVERGEEVIISRHGRAIAKLVPVGDQRQSDIDCAAERLRAFRSTHAVGSMTREEIRSARDEGRRF